MSHPTASPFSNPAGGAAEAAGGYTAALLDLLGDRDPLAVQAELVPALRRLSAGLSDGELRRPERPGKWSVMEVVEHLADQELVNGYRIRSVVAEDEPELRGYDQDRWAARLRYGAADLETVMSELAALRGRNLRLLRALPPAELERAGLHSERGPETVRRIMLLTAGHDLLHRRQIERIRSAIGRPVGGA
ncbi:MAG TPA: DinB family protein [Gemmatimonadaceae bacterium]|nr:DinB family protein [Gemmatimonadaceae bacterium]